MRIELAVVTSCEDCGLCCSQQGTPPMDMEEYNALPDELKWDRATHGSRYDYGLPCLWYDGDKKQCSNYDHRGLACREFEVGGEVCLRMRAEELR